VIGFLYSDDLCQHNNVIETVVEAFQKHQVDSVYSDLTYVAKDDTDKVIRYWESGDFSFKCSGTVKVAT